MKFAHCLTYHRERAGLNMSQLAERLGVSSVYVIQIENGKSKPPSFERCAELVSILGLSDAERKHFLSLAFEERINDDIRAFLKAINE